MNDLEKERKAGEEGGCQTKDVLTERSTQRYLFLVVL